MKLSAFKQLIASASQLNFIQPNGHFVPRHFHITEAGLTTKHFIDCGGTVRIEKAVNFQLWVANDYEHRLQPQKLLKIIDIASPLFGNEDLDVEIEYQSETIGRYGLNFDGENFLLTALQTNCLAQDHCGIPQQKQKIKLADLQAATADACCAPGGGCC